MQVTNKALVMKAMGLLDRAGAVYKIWTEEDIRSTIRLLRHEVEDGNIVLVVPEDDDVIVRCVDMNELENVTDNDWEILYETTRRAIMSINETRPVS